MNKKGVELSMNLIIIAAIALLVLIVLALIFTGSIGNFLKGNACPDKGGTCKATKCDTGESQYTLARCPTKGDVCCIPPTP